jgi:hypothetical protein
MKRSFFRTLAAALLASLAFATSSQAGTVVTTNVDFGLGGPVAAQTSIVIDYSASTGPITGLGDLKFLTTPTTTVTATQTGADQVTVTFAPAPGATQALVSYQFTSGVSFPNAPTSITVSGVTATPGPSSLVTTSLSYSLGAVPEPTSMALLGIGMTGFLAFRRLFKRTSVA